MRLTWLSFGTPILVTAIVVGCQFGSADASSAGSSAQDIKALAAGQAARRHLTECFTEHDRLLVLRQDLTGTALPSSVPGQLWRSVFTVSAGPSTSDKAVPTQVPLLELVAAAGYAYSKVDDSTWRLSVKGRAIFVSESAGRIGFVLKVANRDQLAATPTVLSALLARNYYLSRAKLSLSDLGDLLLSSSTNARVTDLVEFKSNVDELLNSSEIVSSDIRRLLNNPPIAEHSDVKVATTSAEKKLAFASSEAMGPRKTGRGGEGFLIVRAGAIAYQEQGPSGGFVNGFSASCKEILSMKALDGPDRLRIELKGQAYELREGRDHPDSSRRAMELVAVACAAR